MKVQDAMIRFVVHAGCLAVLFCATGCGVNADKAVQDDLEAINELADALRTREESRIDLAQRKFTVAEFRLRELKLTKQERDKLFRKHEKALTGAYGRLREAGWTGNLEELHFGDLMKR